MFNVSPEGVQNNAYSCWSKRPACLSDGRNSFVVWIVQLWISTLLRKLCERIHIFHSACPGHLQLASGYQLVGEEALWSVCGIGTSAGKMCASCGGKKKKRGASEAFSHHIMWQWTTFLLSLSTRKKKLFLLWNSSHLWHKSVRNGGVSAAEFFPRLLNNDVLGWNAYIASGILRCLAAPLLIIFRRIWPRFWWEAFC